MAETIFTKIIRKEIPADIVFESDNILAFKDLNPQAPVHILLIPKEHISYATEIDGKRDASMLGQLFDAANQIAKEQGIDKNGFRLVINCRKNGGQEVPHLHMHLLGGRKMKWPPG
jgi:histidine triad (HIT) family protein